MKISIEEFNDLENLDLPKAYKNEKFEKIVDEWVKFFKQRS